MTNDMEVSMRLHDKWLLRCRLASSAEWSYNLAAWPQGRPVNFKCKEEFDRIYISRCYVIADLKFTHSSIEMREFCVNYSI
jgi:hypothetical protein